jgi:hypothetical protein
MLAIFLIYLTGLGLCSVAGVAVTASLHPQERWLTAGAPAAGAALIIVLAFVLGFLLPGSVAAVLICVVIVLLLALAVWRRRARAELRAALLPSRGELLALGLGGAAGVLLLIPVLSLGFPTTIASGIADGWARSVLSEWLIDNPLVDSARTGALARPTGTYSVFPGDLGAGFEYLVAVVSTLTGRRAYQVVLPLAAVAAPIAVSGWAELQSAITQRRPEAWQALLIATAVAAPMFVLPFAENYLTQLVSLSLWPFAIAATIGFARRPAVGTAVLAAVGLGAVAGVYPQLAPWLAPPALLLVLVVTRRVRPALAALAGLGLALLIVAPIELVRAYHSVVLFSGTLDSNPSFPRFQAEQDLGIVLGGVSQFSVAGLPRAQLLPVLVLLVGAAAIAVAAVTTMAREERRLMVTLGVGVGGVTLATYLKYKVGDEYGYGAYKALISGGALLAGLLMLALASPSARSRSGRVAAAAVCLALWVPVTAQMLQAQRNGAQGFREGDNALIPALERLPARDVVLVEGAAPNARSFQLRMTTGYVAEASEGRRFDGLGSTSSYFTSAGTEAWRPARPWDYVVVSDAPSAFPAHRRTIWQRPPYRIQAAPALDVTPYATRPGWITPPAGSPPSDYIAAPVELIVANRGAQTARAHLELGLSALRRGRAVVLTSKGGPSQGMLLPAKGDDGSVDYALTVPAGSTARVTLDPGARVLGPDGQPAPLLALTRVGVR